MGQDSVLSPILSTLYLAFILYTLEKCLKILKIPVSILSFIDDRLLIVQSKSLTISNNFPFYSYRVISSLLEKFRLILEHRKTKIFNFSRSNGIFNLPSLNLSMLGGSILCSKNIWKYLGFIFDRKLFFYHHINYYVNKVISTIEYMKILGNSVCGLILHQKWLLYRSCILSIALYGFQLCHYNKVPLSYPLNVLKKMQRRAVIWILGMFWISLSLSIEAIAGLIPIYLHLYKLSGRA